MFYDNNKNLRIEIFGFSHAPKIGVKIYGVRSGEKIDVFDLQKFLNRRKSDGVLSTSRVEEDKIEIISGINNGITDGNTLEFVIFNKNVREKDYKNLDYIPRPSTADYVSFVKGDYQTGGGAYSGRMTACICIAGGVIKQLLEKQDIKVYSHIYSVGDICDTPFFKDNLTCVNCDFPVIDKDKGKQMLSLVKKLKEEGDSVGGIIECAITNLPVGLGGELEKGLESKISNLLFAIPAVKGVEFGVGFNASKMQGSLYNDQMQFVNGKIEYLSNNDGGIVGGTSNGNTLIFRVAFKPVPSINKEQNSVNLNTKENVKLKIEGRHDTAIVLRATPIVESCGMIAVFGEIQNPCSTIDEYRKDIDYIDDKIAELLSKRINLVEQIGELKKQNAIKVLDIKREKEITDRLIKKYPELKKEIEKVYKEIFDISKSKENGK